MLFRSPFLAGRSYSIADISVYPWLRSWQNQGIDWADYPHLKAWYDKVESRPAVQRGVQVLSEVKKPPMDAQARASLFGAPSKI